DGGTRRALGVVGVLSREVDAAPPVSDLRGGRPCPGARCGAAGPGRREWTEGGGPSPAETLS
ncbi:unnamed protein product, partial [Amoebophrya sp. A120]